VFSTSFIFRGDEKMFHTSKGTKFVLETAQVLSVDFQHLSHMIAMLANNIKARWTNLQNPNIWSSLALLDPERLRNHEVLADMNGALLPLSECVSSDACFQ
jgi:hypothetical protein